MTRKSFSIPDPTPDLFASTASEPKVRVKRAADIVTPPRAAQHLPAPSDWSFELIEQYHAVIRETAQRFGLDTYPNQLEVITAEQMMDAYEIGRAS